MKIEKRCCTLGPMLLLISWFLIASTLPAIADEATGQAIDYEAGFYYTVKKGDTLWDLSQKFSDTPWQWPDLWHENKQLPNPHWIYPGERIRLFRKTEQHRISETASKEVTVVPQAQADAPAKPHVDFFYGNIDRVGFIRKPAVDPLGVIFKSLGDKRLISKNDSVYIRYAEPGSDESFTLGTRMTVYRALPPTDDSGSIDDIGTQHLLVGLVEVTKKEAEFAVAKVVKSYRAIRLEDMLMPYEPQKPDIAVIDSTPGIDGRIISGENHNQLLSDHYIAFIDKGAKDDIKPGQVYQLYKQQKAPVGFSGRMADLDRTSSGSVLILHTEKTTSTVVITHNTQKITPGDRFQTP